MPSLPTDACPIDGGARAKLVAGDGRQISRPEKAERV